MICLGANVYSMLLACLQFILIFDNLKWESGQNDPLINKNHQ